MQTIHRAATRLGLRNQPSALDTRHVTAQEQAFTWVTRLSWPMTPEDRMHTLLGYASAHYELSTIADTDDDSPRDTLAGHWQVSCLAVLLAETEQAQCHPERPGAVEDAAKGSPHMFGPLLGLLDERDLTKRSALITRLVENLEDELSGMAADELQSIADAYYRAGWRRRQYRSGLVGRLRAAVTPDGAIQVLQKGA